MNKIQKFERHFNNKNRECQDLSQFVNELDSVNQQDEPGVNDFSVKFHRTPFDYCDGYYVPIKVDGKYNFIYYEWSQYSGYHYYLISNEWFTRYYLDCVVMGNSYHCCYNHIEYDYNAGRFCCGGDSTMIKVENENGFNLLDLPKKKLISETWFEQCDNSWHNEHDGRYLNAVINGSRMKITTKGGIIYADMNLTSELENIRKTFTNKTKILEEWINQDKPCGYRYGFSFKGAGCRTITKEVAIEKLKKHTFGKGFWSMNFEISADQSKVMLVFEELSENDMW